MLDSFDRLSPTDRITQIHLNQHLVKIEELFKADAVTIYGTIGHDVVGRLQRSIDLLENKEKKVKKVAVILNTTGGLVEVVERVINIIRHSYDKVYFLIPDIAMSSGTVLATFGDKIFMSYSACLGPIDPQVFKDDKFIPALAYLNEYEELLEKSKNEPLTSVEFALINKLDLGELHQFQQARELSMELLTKGLTAYNFKDCNISPEQKEQQAKKIADALSDNKLWHSHARMLSRDVLRGLGIKIEDMENIPDLLKPLNGYTKLLNDYLFRGEFTSFIGSREFF